MVLLCCLISAVSNVLPIAEIKQLLFCLVTLLKNTLHHTFRDKMKLKLSVYTYMYIR